MCEDPHFCENLVECDGFYQINLSKKVKGLLPWVKVTDITQLASACAGIKTNWKVVRTGKAEEEDGEQANLWSFVQLTKEKYRS